MLTAIKIIKMRKSIYLILISGFFIACSGGEQNKTEEAESTSENTEIIEEKIQEVDKSIQSSESEINKKQEEIDSLLDNI